MTIVEMHELCDLLIDKANAPWFNPAEKDKFIRHRCSSFVESYIQNALENRYQTGSL